MNKTADSKTILKFLDAYILVRRVRIILSDHSTSLSKGFLVRYNLTRVELDTFTFSAGSKSLSVDKAVLVPNHKRMLFTMIRFADFIGPLETNPHKSRHYNISDISQFGNGKQVISEGLL